MLLQTLRYADWLRSNPDTIRYQISRQGWDIDPDEIEDNIKIYIVAPRISRVVAELAQYIQGLEFEFVQVQRFENPEDGKVLAVVSPLEVPNRTTIPTRVRIEHDLNSYRKLGMPEDSLDRLNTAVEDLVRICNDESWELAPRMLKNAVKFQTGGGRNVFMVALRKREDHRLRFCLGQDFDLASCQLSDAVKNAIRHNPESRWWGVPLQTSSINDYRPLLTAAYSYVTGTG